MNLIAVLLALCWGRSQLLAAPFPGLLGMSLPDARKTDFFSWFHLEETGRKVDSNGRMAVSFKPDGEAFHKLLTVRTALDAQERIVQIDLYLSRAFINDRTERAFANDIAKSLLLDTAMP